MKAEGTPVDQLQPRPVNSQEKPQEKNQSAPIILPQVSISQLPVVTSLAPESRPWRAPDFSDQKKALGYPENGFTVPKGMEKQVRFWVNIYTKYSTDEGVIHDSDNVEKIYEVVDLKGLKSEREKQKKIDGVKAAVSLRLKLDRDAQDRLRFQLGQKDRMQDAIFKSGRYLEDMEKVFREEKVPAELTRLAFVESAFNVMARSKVGASGIWQIMPYTARPYRMISPAVDKRNDPMSATKFAAKLLRQNYNMLESWPLAVTGYNHGPTGVKKMTNEYKSRELSHLIENVDSRRSFGFASRNFYACFLAVLEVERNAKTYFGTVAWAKPLNFKVLKLPIATRYADLVKWFEGNTGRLQLFNPHLTSLVTKKGYLIPAHTVISVPHDKYDVALVALAHRGRSVASEEKKD